MLNNVSIMGRLARDPELRTTTSGKSVVSFTIANDRDRKDANGQNQTDWIRMTAWEKTAEFICKYFQKGSMIAIEGRLQSKTYQDKNGTNRTDMEVVVEKVHFVGAKSASNTDSNAQPAAAAYCSASDGSAVRGCQ